MVLDVFADLSPSSATTAAVEQVIWSTTGLTGIVPKLELLNLLVLDPASLSAENKPSHPTRRPPTSDNPPPSGGCNPLPAVAGLPLS
ncbi:hypothetical protein DTO195F2_5469 [Paecilomyces variotii]|nr:hypothetical protein DTO195F2_5469 [Paecilomyces variotii]